MSDDIWARQQVEYYDDGTRFGTGPELVGQVKGLRAESARLSDRLGREAMAHDSTGLDLSRVTAERDRATANEAYWRGQSVERELALEGDPAKPVDAARLLAALLLDNMDTCPCCGASAPCDAMGATGDPVQHADGCPMAMLLSRCGLMDDARNAAAELVNIRSERDRLAAVLAQFPRLADGEIALSGTQVWIGGTTLGDDIKADRDPLHGRHGRRGPPVGVIVHPGAERTVAAVGVLLDGCCP